MVHNAYTGFNTYYIVLLPAESLSNNLNEFKIGGVLSKHIYSLSIYY